MRFILNIVKPFIPFYVRQKLRALCNQVGNNLQIFQDYIAGWIGVLPDFLIIGAQKCGTTSLYNYLLQHPSVYPATKKEIGFFDRYPANGIRWYRSHFPSFLRKYLVKVFQGNGSFVTGEASTGYILYPNALRRIEKALPNVKLILILRNPVDRAYSHYQHTTRIGKETLSFEEAIKEENERVARDWRKLRKEENFFSLRIALFSYCGIGLYSEQVRILLDIFPKERILILQNKDLFKSPVEVISNVVRFLGLPDYHVADYQVYNKGEYIEMDKDVRRKLADYFSPYNRELNRLLTQISIGDN